MRFMIIVRAASGDPTASPTPAEPHPAMVGYNAALVKAGVLLAGEGLSSSAAGARIRFEGEKRTLVAGEVAEATEPIAGFWLIQVRSREEAIEWARRIPLDAGEAELYEAAEITQLDRGGGVPGAGVSG